MRLQGLDVFRGLAIVLMVCFHFSFDLNNFHYVDFDLKHGLFWHYFRYLIVTMFVFSAGISLHLAHQKGIVYKKVGKRVLILGAASLLVSVGSYTQFPNSWIYFGILHFFLFSSLVGLPFLRLPKISLALAIGILLAYNFSWANMHWLYKILQAPLHLPIYYTEDLANIIPWFGVFLLGSVFAYYKLHIMLFHQKIFDKKNKLTATLSFFGKHSLLIYLLHQPFLFAIFLLLK